MGEDVLSQTEVESLLSAIDPTRTAAVRPSAPVASAPNKPKEKVTPYDFKRPERVGKEQMRALQSLHEGFGRNFSASLSGVLRTVVDVKLTSVDQLTYSEFVFSLENPTCFNVLSADPLEGNLILDINPSILHPIIERMLGGKENDRVVRRALTDIELRLVARITRLFLDELHHAWENVLDLTLEVVRVESNPQLVSIVPPNEVIVLISFEVMLGEMRGMINLCVPYNSIERISSKLAANNWQTYGKMSANDQTRQYLSSRINKGNVELVVTLAETKITTSDLIGLRVGDIITTSRDVNEPLDVTVNEAKRYEASPGSLKGHKAIEIQGVIPPSED